MKKLILTTMAVGAMGLTQAFGLLITMGASNSGPGNYQATPLGEFSSVLDNYAAGAKNTTQFGTFCLERNEFFTPGSTVLQVELSLHAKAGGNGGPYESLPGGGVGDPISKGTAELYRLFATGQLNSVIAGYSYSSGSANDELQNAFWRLEGETPVDNDNVYFDWIEANVANFADNYDGTSIRVMNLTHRDSAGAIVNKQDQLVYLGVPDGGMTLALLGLGLAGLATIRRRFMA
ncbi:MAG: VPDSG-CTERM sorting domain-containing protein [Opitutaceae bacterium]